VNTESTSKVVIGIDLGTTRVKVIAFNPELGSVVASTDEEYPTSVPAGGGSEQNPADWWSAVSAACRKVVDLVNPANISAVGLSGHMHGLLLLDRTLEPVRPAMTWSDRRVGASSEKLKRHSRFRELGGNDVVDAFTAPKLAWLSATEPETLKRAAHLLLAKDYLCFRLTGQLGTDVTDAMGTLLWDVKAEAWDEDLFRLCGSSSEIAPEVVKSSEIRGTITQEASRETGLLAGTPVVAGAGDVSAAALGAGLADSSIICLSAGTAAQAMGSVNELNAGNGFIFGKALGTGFIAMSSVYAAGASIAWAQRVLFSSQSIENMARQSSPGSDGLSYLPFMSGAVVPRKNDSARAAFVGQTPNHSAAHLASAVLEGVAFACADAVEAIMELTGKPQWVHVVGGVANSGIWQSVLSSVLDVPIVRLPHGGSAVGAALLAAVGTGMSSQERAVESLVRVEAARPDEETVETYRTARTRFTKARDLLV
jgi:xylulokinase